MNLFGEEIQENPFENAKTFEKHLEYLLKENNYFVLPQHCIGEKPTGGKHIVDILANQKIIVSAKIQNVGGTAEEKIPYEQLMLQYACDRLGYTAYIVCAGEGWTILNYFVSDEYSKLINTSKVRVMKYFDFLKEITTL